MFYEGALTEFFENSSVRYGVVVSTIRGTTIEISEEMFTAAFDLPTELTDLSKRRMIIIAKYRELLLQKFIEAKRRNFVSGTPTSAIDLKVLNLLIAAHHFALKELLRHMREHQLEWTRPSSSSLFEGANIDRGFFIPHNHRSILSKCWIRSKIMVDGSWLILEGVDYWRPITNPVNSRNWEALPQRPYIDDLAPLCVLIEPVQDVDSRAPMSRAIHILWEEICVEVIQFSLLRSLLPIGSMNICMNIVVHSSVVDVLEKLPNHFCILFSRIDFVQRSDSPTHTDSPMRFKADDISLDSTPDNQILLPVGPTEFSTSLADLQTFLSERIYESQIGILSKLHTIERSLHDSLLQQEEAFRTSIQGARQEVRTIDDVQTLRFN
ncbi:hypothetical protein F511_37720 [Dorcoceras hygrometricum]|uniref:Uncharacterized protein n=1 Tax=Dorcoceras hygrometricum TaxID=472368 RepID=A0A2Z7CX63_9LAMI|nr:hypothetical protein F511_37720 [Dorcoceras hygrometricum]